MICYDSVWCIFLTFPPVIYDDNRPIRLLNNSFWTLFETIMKPCWMIGEVKGKLLHLMYPLERETIILN